MEGVNLLGTSWTELTGFEHCLYGSVCHGSSKHDTNLWRSEGTWHDMTWQDMTACDIYVIYFLCDESTFCSWKFEACLHWPYWTHCMISIVYTWRRNLFGAGSPLETKRKTCAWIASGMFSFFQPWELCCGWRKRRIIQYSIWACSTSSLSLSICVNLAM